jgi:hypothetical protein
VFRKDTRSSFSTRGTRRVALVKNLIIISASDNPFGIFKLYSLLNCRVAASDNPFGIFKLFLILDCRVAASEDTRSSFSTRGTRRVALVKNLIIIYGKER